jgi:hypothetical protein
MNININDYLPNEVFSGNGASMEELQNLNKALDAQAITGRDTANSTTAGGAALKVESLDKTLKVITFSESNIKLWKMIPKKTAYNTVEEFNQLASYGNDRGGSLLEGELPSNEDSTYIRRSQLVKFYGVTKSVTHPMSLVNTQASVGNIVEREVKNGTLWILRKVNKALTRGNSAIIPTEFNGLYAQHAQNDLFSTKDQYYNSEVVVDLRGAPLTEVYIERGAEAIVENYGVATHLIAPPAVLSKFVASFYGNKFIPINSDAVRAGEVGQAVQTFQSQYGPIKLEWDVFMNPEKPRTLAESATDTKAPLPIVVDGTTPIAVNTDATSKWVSADAGNYLYAVASVNRFGESALTALSSTVVAAVAGSSIDLKFTAAVSDPNPATGFTIYRSNKGATTGGGANATFYPLFQISTAELGTGFDGTGANVVRDKNRILPSTANALLIQNDSETFEFAQLAPLMKMDLAIISPAYRFMIMLYGTPLLYAPKRIVRYINVGV